MIVLLNGPFGIGKTATARLLVERMPRALLYDPENVGVVLRRLLGGIHPLDDFQDYTLWPRLTIAGAGLLRLRSRTLIVPMTIARRPIFDTVTSGLRRVDRDLVCLRLTASEDELRCRILSRADSEGPHHWCLSHLEEGMAMSHDPAFGIEMPTDGRSVSQVADGVLALLGFAAD